jgi:thymidylate synthase
MTETGDFRDHYRRILSELLDAPRVVSVKDPHSIGSSWGTRPRDFRELISYRFSINTNNVMLDSTVRPISREYAIGSSKWILAGRNDLESVNALNPRGSQFSLDGFTLSGAFGHRLRVENGDQIESVVELLRHDVTTRRAIAFIARPHDLMQVSRDFPCASSVQFFLREDHLHAVVSMRSQSLFGVFPYDLVNFRYLQQYVGWRLGVDLGSLHFSCASAHIYEEEVERISEFMDSPFSFSEAPALEWADFLTPTPDSRDPIQ